MGDVAVGEKVVISLRPESLELVDAERSDALGGEIVERQYRGEVTYYRVSLEMGGELLVVGEPDKAARGEQVRVALRQAETPARAFPVPEKDAS
jgi:ABC-type Fe3+/spermidine/putrescine transport system ATPase subunit